MFGLHPDDANRRPFTWARCWYDRRYYLVRYDGLFGLPIVSFAVVDDFGNLATVAAIDEPVNKS